MLSIYSFAEHAPYLAIFSLLLLGGVGLPFPEDATLLLCGFLLAHDVVNFLPAVLIILGGDLLTDFLIFSFGKHYGRSIAGNRRFRKVVTPERLAQLEDKFRKRGGTVILLGRHFIGLRVQLFLAAGISRFPAVKFLVFDAMSSLITMTIFITIGYLGGNSFQIIRRDISRVEHLVLFLSVAMLFVFLFVRHLRLRSRIKQVQRSGRDAG